MLPIRNARLLFSTFALLAAGLSGPATGQVHLIGERIKVSIEEGVARTEVVQRFRNQRGRQAEHTFLFPLPADAVVSDFRLEMNGKLVRGDVLDRDQARGIYEAIVRRQRDPGLLEYLGCGLVQARIFPVPARGEVEVLLGYSSVLGRSREGLREYVYPLRRQGLANQPLKSLLVEVAVRTRGELGAVYSPTHAFELTRESGRSARLVHEAAEVLPRRDLRLFCGEREGELGVALLTHRRQGEDGYFLALLSPALERVRVQAKDIAFAVDVSGSMKGQKLAQVKEALRYCLGDLDPRDRFALVPFSGAARPFASGLREASPAVCAEAVSFVDQLAAEGGTNIEDAMKCCLALDFDPGRPFFVLFLTDGLPTIGERRPKRLIGLLDGPGRAGVRICSLGVGYDVNTQLLDLFAEKSGAEREYVRPGEDLEQKLVAFYDKVAVPVLTGLDIAVEGLETHDVYPKGPLDLFRGAQVVVAGRYRGSGCFPFVLRGRAASGPWNLRVESEFPALESEHSEVAELWAWRKVGYLLDQIRLQRNSPELREEVARLGREYGIVTPFTAALVLEEPDRQRIAKRYMGPGGPSTPSGPSTPGTAPPPTAAPATGPATRLGSPPATRPSGRTGGSQAVEESLGTRDLKKTDSVPGSAHGAKLRRVAGRGFRLSDGVWIEEGVDSKQRKKAHKLRFLSKDYLELMRVGGELARILALGERVVFRWKGTLYEITPAKAP